MAYYLPFLTQEFIVEAMMGTEDKFNTSLALLNSQTIPLNANPDQLIDEIASPITFCVYAVHAMRCYVHRLPAVIEALHLHCGIPTTRCEPRCETTVLLKSPLWITTTPYDFDFGCFKTLLKLNASFDANDSNEESALHFLARAGRRAVPFLELLPNNGPCMNPNIQHHQGTALHIAVSLQDPSPDAVRLLVRKFGADPTIRNNDGNLPSDVLRNLFVEFWEIQQNLPLYPEPRPYDSDRYRLPLATLLAHEDRVCRTDRILTHTDRVTAVLMGVCLGERNQESELRNLDTELAAMILRLADQ